MRPTLLTVLLNYRTADMTLKAAEAALRETAGIPGELIIVDNDSRDGSFEALRDAASTRGWTENNRVRVMSSGHNGGYGAGNNYGIRQGLSDGRAPDFILLLNSDVFLDPGAVEALMAFLESAPQAGFAGSQVRGDDEAPHTTHFRFPTIAGELEQSARLGIISRLLPHAIIPMPPTKTPVRADWVAGASLLIRREALDAVGLFDEAFFLYFEETDLCLRAARAGWQTWFVPQSTAVHLGSASTGMKSWARTPGYWFASRRHYFAKNHGRAYLAGANAARIAGSVAWRLRRLISHRPLGEPPRFLSDFLLHMLSANIPFGRPRATPPAASHQFAKDSK